MNAGLIGYGKMGKVISKTAAAQGVSVAAVFDVENPFRHDSRTEKLLENVPVLIDFSTADAVVGNIKAAAGLRKNLVVGTTGWTKSLPEAEKLVNSAGTGLVCGSNFSIGVNLFYRITAFSGELFRAFDTYDAYLTESHHKFKADAPSGTALNLLRILKTSLKREEIPVSSTRAGYIPGMHEIGFDSEVDTVTIQHRARSREGFARGALLAAKWIENKQGFYEFSDVIEEIISNFT